MGVLVPPSNLGISLPRFILSQHPLYTRRISTPCPDFVVTVAARILTRVAAMR